MDNSTSQRSATRIVGGRLPDRSSGCCAEESACQAIGSQDECVDHRETLRLCRTVLDEAWEAIEARGKIPHDQTQKLVTVPTLEKDQDGERDAFLLSAAVNGVGTSPL